MSLPTTAEGWAIHLSKLVRTVHEAHGSPRFPINVASIAQEYSGIVFPQNPISRIEGAALSARFEGMLMPHPDKNGEWGIIYNSNIHSKGRINFTLAHELGHYLLHRHLSTEGFQCSAADMRGWNSEYGQREAQANTFASYLLMPLDDFRAQTNGATISLAFMRGLSERYEVSITAAILKWLSITRKRAMIVVSKDGFIDWAWASERLIRSGIFYRARQEVTPVPTGSLAARNLQSETELIEMHSAGVWPGQESVREFTMFARRSDVILTMLLYPDDAPVQIDDGDDGLLAADEHFATFGQR